MEQRLRNVAMVDVPTKPRKVGCVKGTGQRSLVKRAAMMDAPTK